jgi:hypothetical protein
MMPRRWLVLSIVAIAIVLLSGRVFSAWYVDYQWYAVQGASRLWWERTLDLSLLRGAAFAIVSTFAFLNLYAVRRSVRSLRLPRRVGNLEFSEEVSARILNSSVIGLSVVIGIAFALPHDDWMSVALMRNGILFGETDPYFRLDLGTWLYQLPFESSAYAWAMIALVAMTLLVIFLYALTPSLRWESGQLRVSGHVRRHFAVLAGVLLLLLAWSYRLDAFSLLLHGTGPLGALSAVDHRVGIPASLSLAMLAVAAGMLVTWTGWIGQVRASFIAVTVMLLAALGVSQVVPAVGGRFVIAEDPDAQEQSYREIRNAYSRRAYAVDAVERTTFADAAPSFAEAIRGASVWDSDAMRQVVGGPRQGARPNGAMGWQAQDGRLVAFSLEQPLGAESAEALPAWGLTRVAADVTDDRGSPITRDDPELARSLRGVLVHDSASTYYVLSDTGHVIVARSLNSFVARLAHAWHLQNPALLNSTREAPARVLLRRDVRERISHLYPFFTQGSRVAPVVWRDSVFWAVHLYATSIWYPLSSPQRLLGDEVRYTQLAGIAVVNGHTGRVTTIASPRAGPMAESWMLRFPELFSDPTVFDMSFLNRLPPAFDGTLMVARVLAQSGFRGEFDARAHLPGFVADSVSAAIDPAPWLNRTNGAVSLAIPLLEPTDDVRGLLLSPGGAEFRVQWIRNEDRSMRWPKLVADLQAAVDSFKGVERTTTRPLIGAIRILPTADGLVAIQTQYVVRPDGAPQVHTATIHRGVLALTGRTLIDAAGLPHPVVADLPITPEDFRRRVSALYESMREAMRRGDWTGIGAAYEALGRLLRAPPP